MVDPTSHSFTPLPQTGEKNLEAFRALLEVDEKERSFSRRQGYLTAYFLSVLIPPIGLYYFFKYVFFSDRTPEDIRAGCISLGLTVISLLLSIWLIGAMFSTPLKNTANGADSLKQFVTPENMKVFRDLMK